MAAEVTADLLQQCQKIVADSIHYSDLVEAEVATLVGLGLRPAIDKPKFLSCLRCKNSKRKEYKFQGSNEVRQHFQGHEELPCSLPWPRPRGMSFADFVAGAALGPP